MLTCKGIPCTLSNTLYLPRAHTNTDFLFGKKCESTAQVFGFNRFKLHRSADKLNDPLRAGARPGVLAKED